jgi:type I restriction enzyme R subunit
MSTEPDARIIIDKFLREAGWIMPGEDQPPNVTTEITNDAGEADYVLLDSKGFPLCAIEAKRSAKSPLVGKEQARGYADSLKCRFILLSNSIQHYLWDLDQGSPFVIEQFPSQAQLEMRKNEFNPPIDEHEEIENDYVTLTQFPKYKQHPDYLDEENKEDFINKNKLKFLRDYQLNAVHAVQKGIKEGKDRFLLEMATGTGKTLTSTAIMKMFLRLYKVKRVLFLVDRIELENQAKTEFNEILSDDYQTVIWKDHTSDWRKAEIVVSTVQSFVTKNKYKKIFNHNDFDLVISDEAHRSLGARSRRVFEYFNGFKLGLTATPKNFLRSVDIDKLGEKDPRQLEKRFMLDTYTTFGCESGEPTFRYSLEDGVKDGYLINPRVLDARTEITTDLLSKEGYFFEGEDEEGKDISETFTKKDFEKKFFSKKTNIIFCETFLKNAKRDPYTGEIGKTLIFCASQSHATKITQILNVLTDKMFPNQYRSDFAVQVTSEIENAQTMTINFTDRNNSLNGQSQVNPYYKTSKTRVCVTVGMMTTGYDCKDILNICLMRPVYSPSEFIQMKGRGTRKNDFRFHWISDNEIPQDINSQKEEFLLFDFMGNYEYFEKDFDYDDILELPKKPSIPVDTGDDDDEDYDDVTIDILDPIKLIEEIRLGNQVMRIDRDLYPSFKRDIQSNQTIKEMVENLKFDDAEQYLIDNVLDKPQEFYTLDKLKKSLELDRKLTVSELLLYAFDHIDKIKTRKECIEEEFEKFDDKFHPSEDDFYDTKQFFESYILDKDYRDIIDSKRFAELNVHPSGQAFKNIPREFREQIPLYVRENVDMERLVSA